MNNHNNSKGFNSSSNNNSNNNILQPHRPQYPSHNHYQQSQQSQQSHSAKQNINKQSLNHKRKFPDSSIGTNSAYFNSGIDKNKNNHNFNNNNNNINNNNNLEDNQSEEMILAESITNLSPLKKYKSQKEVNIEHQPELLNSSFINNNNSINSEISNGKRSDLYKDILKSTEFLSSVQQLDSRLKESKDTLKTIKLDLSILETRLKALIGLNTILVFQSSNNNNDSK